MRYNVTFGEVIWTMMLYCLIQDFNWGLLIAIVLMFPRWKHYFDEVTAMKTYRENKKLQKEKEDEEAA